jgi:hypothetical protein
VRGSSVVAVRVPLEPCQVSSTALAHSDLAAMVGARTTLPPQLPKFLRVQAAIRPFDTDKEGALELIRA